MEFTLGSGGDEHEASNSNKRRSDKKAYQRHSISQIHQLEEFFKTCPHPDEAQRNQLSKDLGLEVRQVKFWFQNKRTQTKVHYEKSDNSTLRAENERMLCENLAIREALHNIICPSCGTHPPNEEERQLQLLKLQEENAMLKNEHERVSRFLAKFVGRPTHEPSRLSAASSFCNAPPHAMDLSDGLALDFPHFAGVPDVEKPLIAEAAATAIKELIKLLRINEPFWAMTSTSPEGRYVIDRETYKKVFPRSSYLSTATARLESSKDFGVVAMNAAQLVAMMMNEDAMLDLFPSILTKAKTYQVLEEGDTENQSGRLMLMYEQMHILSPLVSPRNFYVLRHCQMVEAGTWVILDLSYNWLKDNLPVTHSWRRPSGCMIEGMPDGQSKITWVEHVEVEDKPGTHPLYRDLIGGGSAYGAERWIVTLQRMCERLKFPYKEIEPNSSKSILKLSQRMLNSFCSNMSMSGKIDFSKLSEVNSSGVRISVRKAVEPGQPSGMIVTAATSLWVPLHHEVLFNFFRDLRNRAEWDILTSGYQLEEVTHITTGAHPGNFTSVIRPHVPIEQYMLVLQECWADQLGGMLVYSPVDVRAMNIAATTGDTSEIPILPTGFIISGDGRRETKGSGASTSASSSRAGGASAGSLLTVVFQILVAETSNELSMEYVSTVNWLISLSVQRIKAALNCSNLE